MVLGGFGTSASYLKKPTTTFANNDGWTTTPPTGAVPATVTIAGKELEAKPTAVAVTPPNFGPGLYSVVTMYDVVSTCSAAIRSSRSTRRPDRRSRGTSARCCPGWRHSWDNSGTDVLFRPGSRVA